MKKFLLFFLVTLICAADSIQIKAQIDENSGYKLIFQDEFNQKNGSQPDSKYWTRVEASNSMWAQWIRQDKDLVYIKNGKLVCLGKPNKNDKTHKSMRTGAIWTKDKFFFQYGKVEVRMRTNNNLGNFPAVWMKNQLREKTGIYAEIDIVEMFGNKSESQHCIHSHYTQTTPKHKEHNRNQFSCDVTKWHIYGIEWTETFVRWTVDGITVAVYNKPTDKDLLNKKAWTFDTPFYLIINQSVGDGTYDWAIPNFNKTYKTEFDWIRVYQKKI